MTKIDEEIFEILGNLAVDSKVTRDVFNPNTIEAVLDEDNLRYAEVEISRAIAKKERLEAIEAN